MVPDQGRLIKPEEGQKTGEGRSYSAYMVDGAVPVFLCRFFIILNLVFLKMREIREMGQGGEWRRGGVTA